MEMWRKDAISLAGYINIAKTYRAAVNRVKDGLINNWSMNMYFLVETGNNKNYINSLDAEISVHSTYRDALEHRLKLHEMMQKNTVQSYVDRRLGRHVNRTAILSSEQYHDWKKGKLICAP